MLDNDVMWYWMTGAVALAMLECFVDGFIALGLAVACFVFAILSNFTLLYQNMAAAHFLALAALIVVGFFYFGNRIFWGDRRVGSVTRLGTTFRDKIIGQVAVVTRPIEGGHGSVEANGTVWKCTGPDAPAGTRVVVADILGNTLLVTALSDQ